MTAILLCKRIQTMSGNRYVMWHSFCGSGHRSEHEQTASFLCDGITYNIKNHGKSSKYF